MHINPSAWPFGAPRVLAPTTSSGTRRITSSSSASATTFSLTASTGRVSSTRPLSSATSSRAISSSNIPISSTASTSTVQSSPSSSLASSSGNLFTRTMSTARLSFSRTRMTSGTPSASQTGAFQNATQQINNMPFTAIYVTLLGALLLVVLAVLFYARKAARRNRSSAASSEYGSDHDVEKAPLTSALSYEDSSSYTPAEERPRSLWNRIPDFARASSPSLMGAARPRDLEQGLIHNRRQDDYRPPGRLPPVVSAGPLTPSKARSGRPVGGIKEPKSPRTPRVQRKASAQASTVENRGSSYGELAAKVSPDKLDHLLSMASAKIPPHITTTPLPLRKRVVSKDAVGAPIVTSPIYPGEMMRRPSTALLPVAAARARVAASREQQLRPQSLLDEAIVLERPDPSGPTPLDAIAETEQELESSQILRPNSQELGLGEELRRDQTPSPTSQSLSRPASAARPASAPASAPMEKRGSATKGLEQTKNPFPWSATPPRKINTPLMNEIRLKLLSDRPALNNSHSDETAAHRPLSDTLSHTGPNSVKPRLTSPGDERRDLADKGQIDLSPPESSGFPWDVSRPVQAANVENSWTGSTRESTRSSGSIAVGQPREWRASASATFWSGSNVDPSASQIQATSSTSQQTEGRRDPRSLQDQREEEVEDREQSSDLENRARQFRHSSVSQDAERQRRPSTWSMSSAYSQEPFAGVLAKDYVEEHPALPLPVEPLKLTASRSPPASGLIAVDQQREARSGGPTKDSAQRSEGFVYRASPARSSHDSPPSPTTKKVERGRMDSIASGIIGFFDQPVRTPDPVKSTTTSTAPARSPRFSPALSQRPVTAERTFTPRTNSPSVLPDITHFRGRRTVTPAAQPVAPSPRISFSDAVEVFFDNPAVLSPPARTIRLLTPPSVETQSHYTGDILSPRPVLRRGSVIPPLPIASPNIPNTTAKEPLVRQESAEPPGTTGTPPKAVQTGEMWREIRRTSATAYYLGAFQAEQDRAGDS
ncbi:hypothetical protein NliqN6_1239 [Naganishia liquefaciens]|uniref:Uncharacterized protein n=1 Tax=Naganishia liquefaciens TaxID=104408 RepID=A0A8H3YE25_9TREE|nr:hypothetical protein NliqN6_1239 [Naganishia liquefaciens]